MVIGLIEMSLRLHGVRSLKEKRGIVQPLLHKLKHNFNCAAVESDAQDSHEVAVISVVTINTSSIELEKTLGIIEETTLSGGVYEVEVTRREVFR